MPNRISTEFPGYAFLDAPSVNDQWDGQQTNLQNETSVSVPFTPDGSMILAYENVSKMNSAGSLLLTSGSASIPLTAPALSNQLLVYIRNWQGNSLKITNTTPSRGPMWATPISIQLMGPGLPPGVTPPNLPVGADISISPGGAVQGNAEPRWMQLAISNTNGTQSTIAVIGGPQDKDGNNAYLIAVNYAWNSGPPPDEPPPVTPPAGYYATSKSNNYNLQFNWGSGAIYCANFSGTTAGDTVVVLRAL